jgi:hypothetical protein
VESVDWAVVRARFVEESVTLAQGRRRSSKILDEPDEKRRWWPRD